MGTSLCFKAFGVFILSQLFWTPSWYTNLHSIGSCMLISFVQPLLDGSEHDFVLIIHNLRYLGTVGAKFLDLVLC